MNYTVSFEVKTVLNKVQLKYMLKTHLEDTNLTDEVGDLDDGVFKISELQVRNGRRLPTYWVGEDRDGWFRIYKNERVLPATKRHSNIYMTRSGAQSGLRAVLRGLGTI